MLQQLNARSENVSQKKKNEICSEVRRYLSDYSYVFRREIIDSSTSESSVIIKTVSLCKLYFFSTSVYKILLYVCIDNLQLQKEKQNQGLSRFAMCFLFFYHFIHSLIHFICYTRH